MELMRKEDCKACQMNSDSQDDHCNVGGCLDDTFEFLDVNIQKIKERVKIHEMKQIFDRVRRNIGAPPMYSRLLAKCAYEYVEVEKINEVLKTDFPQMEFTPLVNVIRDAQNELRAFQ